MMEIAPKLAAFASAELRRRGIEIETSTTVERITDRTAELSTGEIVPDAHRGLDRGRQAAPVIAELGLPLDGGGRIAADRFCAVAGRPGVWAIGDAAAVPDPAAKGKASPPTAQHVLRQAKVAADNVAHALAGEPHRRRPFRYRTLGVFVDMGRHQAVASTLGIRWRGFPAWFLARSYHLALMPGAGPPARGW